MYRMSITILGYTCMECPLHIHVHVHVFVCMLFSSVTTVVFYSRLITRTLIHLFLYLQRMLHQSHYSHWTHNSHWTHYSSIHVKSNVQYCAYMYNKIINCLLIFFLFFTILFISNVGGILSDQELSNISRLPFTSSMSSISSDVPFDMVWHEYAITNHSLFVLIKVCPYSSF